MTITTEATYENGVLKPSQPLALEENEKVWVTVEQRSETRGEAAVGDPLAEAARVPIWERIAVSTADAPAEELAKPPTDGASQHDHYLYGTPKRTE